MKKTDLAMIVLIAAVSVGVAYFVANSFLGGKTEEGVKVKTIDSITSSIDPPSKAIFNETAINPSVEVNINQSDDDKDKDAATPPADGATPDTDESTR